MQLSITRRQAMRALRQIILYSILISSSVVLAMPLFWMVSTSLKTVEEATSTIDAITGHEEHVRPPVFKSYLKRLTESKEKLVKATKKLFRMRARKDSIPS